MEDFCPIKPFEQSQQEADIQEKREQHCWGLLLMFISVTINWTESTALPLALIDALLFIMKKGSDITTLRH